MAKSEDGLGLLMISDKPEKGGSSSSDDGDEKTLAAKGLMRALKGDDPVKVYEAFEEMMAVCDEQPRADDEYEDDEAEE